MSSTRSGTTEPADFAAFMKQREEAAAAYVRGNPSPLDAIVPADGAATFFHPRGPVVVGAAEVRARYDHDATSFESGGATHFEVLQSGGRATWPSGRASKLPRYGCGDVMLSCP